MWPVAIFLMLIVGFYWFAFMGTIWFCFNESRLRESAQGDKWSFCLTAGKIGPRIRREHEQETAPEPCIGL
jgi:hypothetical protein